MEIKGIGLSLLLALFFAKADAQKNDNKVATGTLLRNTFTTDKEFKEWFLEKYENYPVNTALQSRLATALNNKKVVVVMGTWCSDSQELVPALFKVLDSISFPNADVHVYGVDREKKTPATVVSKYKISYVPTIVLIDTTGNETGRITENPAKSLEEDLAGF